MGEDEPKKTGQPGEDAEKELVVLHEAEHAKEADAFKSSGEERLNNLLAEIDILQVANKLLEGEVGDLIALLKTVQFQGGAVKLPTHMTTFKCIACSGNAAQGHAVGCLVKAWTGVTGHD